MGAPLSYDSHENFPELAVTCSDTTYNKTGLWRVMRPVIDLERCTRCLICWKFCPDAAIEIRQEAPHIQYDYCKGCGVCAEECPQGCISFEREAR